MKYLIFALTLFAASIAAEADISKPIPTLRLPDGRILKNVTFSSFKSETVMLKHAGGFTLVRYEFLPDDLRAAAENKRPGGPRTFAGDVAGEKQAVEGQVFIQTQGVGPYKFGNVHVYAFAAEHLDTWKQSTGSGVVKLPVPLVQTITDGDGRFKFTVPKGQPFFVFAQADRRVGERMEYFEWRAPSSEIKFMDRVFLSSDWRVSPTRVEIEKQP